MPHTYNILTNQTAINYTMLKTLTRKYQQYQYQRPISARAQAQFQQLKRCLANAPKPLILDSGCGRGMSSRQLAHRYPKHWIIALDQSTHRLAALQHNVPSNVIIIVENCIDFWRLLTKEPTICVEAHYLLYPNPWPKKQQEKRRWYAHPIFPTLLALCPWTHLRSNWLLYLQSCAIVAHQAGRHTKLSKITPTSPSMTHFEAKYHASHTTCFELTIYH